MKKILILGGHGDGLVAAQIIHDLSSAGFPVELAGFLNDNVASGTLIEDIPVLGKITEWNVLGLDDTYYFHPALHKIKDMPNRKAFISSLEIPPEKRFTIIHPTAVISRTAVIEAGALICSHVTVQPGAKIGAYTSIRAGANIGHDAVIEDYCYVGPNATMTGKSILKEGSHLGPNAVISDGITLEPYAIAGAGAAILQPTDAHSIYIGNPARKIMTL